MTSCLWVVRKCKEKSVDTVVGTYKQYGWRKEYVGKNFVIKDPSHMNVSGSLKSKHER